MQKKIRIGTRSSKLALWQARTVAIQLEELGHDVEVVKIDYKFCLLYPELPIDYLCQD